MYLLSAHVYVTGNIQLQNNSEMTLIRLLRKLYIKMNISFVGLKRMVVGIEWKVSSQYGKDYWYQ